MEKTEKRQFHSLLRYSYDISVHYISETHIAYFTYRNYHLHTKWKILQIMEKYQINI